MECPTISYTPSIPYTNISKGDENHILYSQELSDYDKLFILEQKLFDKINNYSEKGMWSLLRCAGGGMWKVSDNLKEYVSSLLLRKYYDKDYYANTKIVGVSDEYGNREIKAGYNMYLLIINDNHH